MSIQSNTHVLTNEQKSSIVKDLEIEHKKGGNYRQNAPIQIIRPYHVHNSTGIVTLPYYYGRNVLGLMPRARDSYPEVNMVFTGALRDYQMNVKRDAIAALNTQGTCLLALHVGWGKSTFAVYLASKLNHKTVIVLNKLMLVKQWMGEVEKYTQSKCQFVKPNMTLDESCDFYIINAINIPKMGDTFFQSVGTCIIDEIHLIMAEKLYQSLRFIHPRYVIGLSATPYRPDGLNKLLDLYCGPDRIVQKLNKPHTVYAVMTRIRIPYDLQPDGKVDWNSVLNNQAGDMNRNRFIVSLVKHHPHRHFLILCKRIQHGKTLVELLKAEKETVTELLGNTRTFDEDARVLVATSQKCGVGFSHNKLDALILASDMEEYFIQYLGRVFRNPDSTPIVFDLVDNMPVLQRHYLTRKQTYITSGGTVHEVSGTDVSMFRETA